MSLHLPRRVRRIEHVLIALVLVIARSAHAVEQEKGPAARPTQEHAAAGADPMAAFARMVPGEWRMTAASGTSMFDTWHWGPGRHSMRVMTDGSDARGNPWRELQVVYWHPGRRQVCLLAMNPYARSVLEGTIRLQGETAKGEFDLYQTGGRRRMGLRWDFDGPDKYHETLLEAAGTGGFTTLAEWDLIRSRSPAAPRPLADVVAAQPSERLKALEPLVGHTWEARGGTNAGAAARIRTTFERIPIIDAIYARVLAPGKDGDPRHLGDAYIYHHTGTNALRCLALSDQGGVYEGDLTVLDGGAFQINLKGHEGDRVVSHLVRFDPEPDGSLRHRVWSFEGSERTLILDVHHAKLESERGE